MPKTLTQNVNNLLSAISEIVITISPWRLNLPFSSLKAQFFPILPDTKSLAFLPPIRAMKSMQGKVVCATNEKTVLVDVVCLAPHPKYKRRVRKKKKFQAHDHDNQFEVGDIVQLEKSRPISKTKTFIAVPIPSKNGKAGNEEIGELGILLESNQPREQST
ncbi:hypothetical protein J1N35_038830 [Gossypium stocksii]|uniref:30S ribosomal protein S17, chloroplastic n=1 Tax=Gossypium stocksii TaxID=47602 RepID=A0A9D3ZM54_9ROSI|nr:hypothetical protein J1N35_038830 [Gossypium stocksii]